MSGVEMVPVGELMVSRGGSVNPAQFPTEVFDLYSIPAFDAGAPEITKGSSIGSTKQVVRPNDVLLSKIVPHIRRAWVVGEDRGRRLIGSGEWIVFRSDRAHPEYLKQVLVGDPFHEQFMQTVSGVGGSLLRARPAFVAGISIPLPPLPEQRRIAAILDQAETLRTQRRAALAQLDSLTQSLFLDMFGDPVTNPKGWPVVSLTDICHGYSGGTPSKANDTFWKGPIPWFSAKDMKAEDLFDSKDHIAETVPTTTTLKLLPKDTVAIVVRGMILAHTFPVCVLRVPATINQDLKALIPRQPIDAQFLAACLRSQSGFVLEQVSEAGHGTKRLDSQGLQKIRVLQPEPSLQQTFATRIQAIEALKTQHRAALAAQDALFASLQQRAFAGTL
ncbi:MAG: restriction endonuclease subunit S [Pseudomonas sp.]|nr:restriction endonuclease subunit S [Pseudomonas sp.]